MNMFPRPQYLQSKSEAPTADSSLPRDHRQLTRRCVADGPLMISHFRIEILGSGVAANGSASLHQHRSGSKTAPIDQIQNPLSTTREYFQRLTMYELDIAPTRRTNVSLAQRRFIYQERTECHSSILSVTCACAWYFSTRSVLRADRPLEHPVVGPHHVVGVTRTLFANLRAERTADAVRAVKGDATTTFG